LCTNLLRRGEGKEVKPVRVVEEGEMWRCCFLKEVHSSSSVVVVVKLRIDVVVQAKWCCCCCEKWTKLERRRCCHLEKTLERYEVRSVLLLLREGKRNQGNPSWTALEHVDKVER
jgi:hypothetical protein